MYKHYLQESSKSGYGHGHHSHHGNTSAESVYNFPCAKEKPSSSKTPLSVKTDKALKRKLNFSPSGQSEDEGEKRSATPKRRRSLLAGEGSPTPGSTTPKTPGGGQRLTERQQMALLKQMTADEGQPQQGQPGQAAGIGDLSPRPSSPHGSALKRTPFDKRIHKRNERGETPLHVAAIRGDLKETKRLIKAGVDVNVADFAGWTAIHEACNHGWLDVAKQLLKSGANVNVQGLDNDTPLHDAAMNGHRKLVELLLRHGANPLQANTSGKSPLDVAKNEEIGKLLRNEIIASSSSSSSLYEVRSPTSPESNASDHDDSHSPSSLAKKLEKDPSDPVTGLMSTCGRFPSLNPSPPGSSAVSSSIGPLSLGIPPSTGVTSSHSSGLSPRSSLLHSTSSTSHSTSSVSPSSSTHNLSSTSSSSVAPTATTTSSIFKKVHVSHHMDHKSSSPRLTIKFQHIKKKDQNRSVSPKRSRVIGGSSNSAESQYKSYSVTLGSKSNIYDRPISPTGSSTSQESDLYDPQLEITTYGSKRASHQVSSSNSMLGPTSRAGQVPPSESVSTSKESPDGSHPKAKVPSPQVDSSQPLSGFSGSPPIGPADSHTISMSQESGPFTPQFEDISDAEDDRHEVQSRSADSVKAPTSTLLSSTQAQYNIPSSSSTSATSKHLLSSRGDVTSTSDSKRQQQQQQGSTGEGGGQPSPPAPSSSSTYPVSSGNTAGVGEGERTLSPSTSSSSGKPDKWRESPHCSSTSQVAHSSPTWDRARLDDSKDSPGSQSSYSGINEAKTSPSSAMDVDVVPQQTDSRERLSPSGSSNNRPVKTDKDKPYLYPDRDNSRSPMPDRPDNRWSPKLDRGDNRWSPKPHKDSHSRPNLKVDVNRASPKPDRESRDSRDSTDSRHSRDSPKSDKEGKGQGPPKVPPLKIIIPPKSTPSEKEHHHHHHQSHQKTVTSRSQLPYVLNPTQESEQVSTSTVTQSTTAQDPTTVCQPSHSSSSTVLEPVAMTEREPEDANNFTAVSSSQDSGFRKGRNKSIEKEKSPSEGKSAAGDDNQSGSGSDKEGRSREAERMEQTEDASRDSSSSKDSSGKTGRNEEGQVEKRVTRSALRSQQQQKDKDSGSNNGKDEPSSSKETKEKEDKDMIVTRSSSNGNNSATSSGKHDVSIDEAHIHPRKRKLRHRQQEMELNTAPPVLPPQHMEKPTNPYELFLDIRKRISSRHKQWFNVQPKAPHGFQDYLMVSCNYVLEGNTGATRRSVIMLPPPNDLTGVLKDLFIQQEKARYRLRLQHVIEREKLMLSIEQEILRVHTRSARALANQSIPLSVCAILRDEDIYNTIDAETEDRDKNIRSRYNGRLFISWLRDVDDKFEKIKESLLLRHHHEAESLYAVQKLEWEWNLSECAKSDPLLDSANDQQYLPMVQVSDDFDLLPA